MIKSFLALLIIAVVSAQQLSLSGNISNAGGNSDWQFRNTQSGAFNGGVLASGGYMVSIAAERSGNTGDIDAVVAAAYYSIGKRPVAWLAYFDANGTAYANNISGPSVDVTTSAGFLGTSFRRITEINSAGATVVSYDLADDVVSGFAWHFNGAGSNGHLKWLSLSGSLSGATVNLTFICSDVVGVLNVANTVVAPRTIETIVTINNWQYANAGNQLVLTLAVGTASSASSSSGQITVGSGSGAVYFGTTSNVVVGGSKGQAKISAWAAGNVTADIGDSNIQAALTTKYGGAFSVQLVNATFPAGATQITWDPAMGVGTNVYTAQVQAPSSAIAVAGNVFILVALILGTVFF